jgi:hypothetical protein
MKLTTHLYLVLKSRMVEIYLHSPYIFLAWCLIRHRDSFTLTFEGGIVLCVEWLAGNSGTKVWFLAKEELMVSCVSCEMTDRRCGLGVWETGDKYSLLQTCAVVIRKLQPILYEFYSMLAFMKGVVRKSAAVVKVVKWKRFIVLELILNHKRPESHEY